MAEKNIKVEQDKELTKKNAEFYKKEKSKDQIIKTYVTSDSEKTKIIENRIYTNGVKKSTLVGLLKNNKVIMDRGIDNRIKKELNIV